MQSCDQGDGQVEGGEGMHGGRAHSSLEVNLSMTKACDLLPLFLLSPPSFPHISLPSCAIECVGRKLSQGEHLSALLAVLVEGLESSGIE
jgi:hypothetical protein